MAIRRILTVDNAADTAVLKQISAPVAEVDDDVRALMDDMLETMYAAPGIGLAAVQVGDVRRVIVMDLNDRVLEGEASPPSRLSDEAEDQRAATRAISSIPRSCGPPTNSSPTKRVACRCRNISTRSNAPAGCGFAISNYDGETVEEEAEGLYRRLHPARDGPP